MASTSDPPAAGGGEASSVAPVASSAEPPPPSSSSSKRRWSPSTWRYAIEEVQPELGSRPRSNPPYSSSSLRADHAPPQATSKSRLLHNQDHAYGKESEEPVRRSVHISRTWGGAELSELRARHAHSRTQDMQSKKQHPPHLHSSHERHHQQKESVKMLEEVEDEDEGEEWDDVDEDGDDVELGHHFEENRKRKKRELSPSELYYCEICRVKAVEVMKPNVSPNSPLPLQEP